MKVSILFTALLFLSGCAVGPLVSHESARTLGSGNNDFTFGYGLEGIVLKWNHGVAENVDIGIQYESFSIGGRIKYALQNQQEKGWSFATAGGVGASVGGSHYYADLMTSHLSGKWEPYGTLRLVKVKTDPLEFRDEDTGNLDFTVSSVEYSYGQLMVGSKYWYSEKWNVSLEISNLFAMSSGVTFADSMLAGLAFSYNF